jgi:hypothetical protein
MQLGERAVAPDRFSSQREEPVESPKRLEPAPREPAVAPVSLAPVSQESMTAQEKFEPALAGRPPATLAESVEPARVVV